MIVLLTTVLVACSRQTGPTLPTNIAEIYRDRPLLQGTAVVTMMIETHSGQHPLTIQLNGDAAPLTAGNFVDLVQQTFYDGLTFHRVVNEPAPFVAQGGDPLSNGTGGYIDPATGQSRRIPLEIAVESSTSSSGYTIYYDTILPETPSITKPPALLHTKGAIAMARSNAPNTASSQFYIALADLEQLDGRYAVFGYVDPDDMQWVEELEIGDHVVSATVTPEDHLSSQSAEGSTRSL